MCLIFFFNVIIRYMKTIYRTLVNCIFSFANTASSLSPSDDACTNSQIIIIIRLAACLSAQHTAGGGADEHTEMAPLYCICSAVIIVSRFRYIGK